MWAPPIPAADTVAFGLSPQSPIGTRRALEANLQAAGLSPRPPEERRSEDMGGAFRIAPWVDPAVPAVPGSSEHVHLLLGLDGALRGVTGHFTAPSGSAKVREWLRRYWESVAGAEPRFQKQAGESDWMPASETARFSAAGARGEWVKIGASESVRIRRREGARGKEGTR
jgi:hypothetical protein